MKAKPDAGTEAWQETLAEALQAAIDADQARGEGRAMLVKWAVIADTFDGEDRVLHTFDPEGSAPWDTKALLRQALDDLEAGATE